MWWFPGLKGLRGYSAWLVGVRNFLQRFRRAYSLDSFEYLVSGPKDGFGENHTWISPMISFSDLSNSFPGSATPATQQPLSMRETDQTNEIMSMHETFPERDLFRTGPCLPGAASLHTGNLCEIYPCGVPTSSETPGMFRIVGTGPTTSCRVF